MDLDPAAVGETLREIAEQYLYDGDTDQPLPGYQAANDLADRIDAIVRATADAIADKIGAAETALAVIYDPVREPVRLSAARYTLGCAAEIARSFGRTPETDTTEATE